MDRRTFVLLTGAASAALWVPPRSRPRPVPGIGNLRFDLDDQRRLALWYNGPDRSIPLLRNAALGVWIGDTLATLADLEDVSVGNRRPPGGESLVIRGRTRSPAGGSTAPGGVWIEAEFLASDSGATGAITVTVYPDRVLATVRGIRFFATSEPQVLPGDGPLVALVNGYQSWSGCSVAALPAEGTSFAAIGLSRGGHGLAAVWEPGDAGEGKVRMAADGGLEAVSEWAPARPVRPDGDGATLRIAYVPVSDGLAALTAAALPPSSVDRERVAALAVPTGWCSRYELGTDVTEADLLANIEFCAARFDRRFFRYIQLDDGYQRAAGDWNTNTKFPHGHRWLTDRIHAAGFQAGLWVAPFAVAESAEVARQNPAWLLKGPPPPPDAAPVVMDTREPWGGRILALDGAHPQAQQWLYDLARRVVREWGYDYLKVDFLEWATAGVTHYGGLTRAEAYRGGLNALREGLGTEAFLLGCGAPLQHAAGLVDGMRIGEDVAASWDGIQAPARAAALRSFYHRSVWLNDPDCLVVRAPLSLDEARVWASVVAMAGGMTMFSDHLPRLTAERLVLLQKTIPVAARTTTPPRALGTQTDEREIAPAVIAGDAIVRLRGPWRFRTGDDARYAARDFDDDAWETIPVPLTWEKSGHPEYDGHAWYRTRFALPPGPEPRSDAAVRLDLGKVDDNDETFLNGVRIGETSGRRRYRRYTVPATALNWGGENVLAIHATDSGGAGGLWSVTRERPASTWVVEGAPRWWTVALINWDDEPRTAAQTLASIGISGAARCAAYDVWAERPLPDVQQALNATLAPHSTLTVALRPVATHPQIIGTTRHVVQGVVDVSEEQWDAGTRTLRGKSVNLDGWPYAVTIAVPRGMRARSCKTDVACTFKRLETGHAVIEWPAGASGDLEWTVTFGSTARR